MAKQQLEAFLYTRSGVEPQLTQATRAALEAKGVKFEEINLDGHRLDDEWPPLPVLSTAMGFIGGLSEERMRAIVSFI